MFTNWTRWLVGLALVASLAMPVSLQAASQETSADAKKPAQSIRVAVVNGTPIYKSELDREVNAAKFQREVTSRPMGEAELKALPTTILNTLIGRTLLYQAALKKGIKIGEQDLQEGIEMWRKQYPPQATMEEILKAMGMTEVMLNYEIKKNLMIQQYLAQTIPADVKVTDKDIMDYVEKHLKDQIREEVRQEKLSQALDKHVEDLKGKAKIEILKK